MMDDVLSDDDEVGEASPWDEVLLLENEDDDGEDDALPFSLVDHEPEPKPQPVKQAAAQPDRSERTTPPQPAAAPPARPVATQPARSVAAPQPRKPPVTRESAPAGPKAEMAGPSIAEGEPALVRSCPFCDSALPGHRPVRYCPYCGQDLTAQPCPSCGETMEAGWMFCVSCGTSRDTP